ncbi:hypothetical protein [Clostridium tertium]|uniref:hypothetical protein n=1 Tax=Clostridium tertium TaxID=1559 RepID=UPI0023B22EDB|nr:hypothetical protein [Clostridium tertium]
MKVNFKGVIKDKVKIESDFLYTINKGRSNFYVLSKDDVKIGSKIMGHGVLDNFEYNDLLILVLKLDKLHITSKIDEYSIKFNLECTISDAKRISNDRYIYMFSKIDDLEDAFDVVHITSITVSKESIDKMSKYKIGDKVKVTLNPIIENSNQNKKRYDMMTRLVAVIE